MRMTAPAALLSATLSLALLGATAPAASATNASAAPPSAATASDLRAQVEQALVGSTARTIGVAVDVDGLGEVLRRNATTSLPPASTQKLYTALTALRVLGDGSRSRTQLRTVGTRYGGLVRGDLYLVSSGDPYLTSAQLDALARSLAATGMKTFSGHLVVDDTRYDRVRRGSGWKGEWVPKESGPLSSMAVDRNAWRKDAAFVADPAVANLTKLREYLARKGIRTTAAGLRRGAVPQRAEVLASHVSSPLGITVRRMLQDSDNFATELLLKEIGKASRDTGTSNAGALEIHHQLEAAGIEVGSVADGSGLSPHNRQTTGGALSLLAAAETSPQYATLRASLPTGCRTGTLEKRFCGTVASGRVFAKTGTLDTVSALTGWTASRDGHLIRFSFLLGGFTSSTQARSAIDRAVVVLAGSRVGG